MKTVLVSLMAAATLPLFAQKDASIRIYPEPVSYTHLTLPTIA